jgi:hydrogenase nickel incorporation protein HypB
MRVKVFQNVLEANDRLAEMNRKTFAEHKLFVLNLIGSPGCGKTTLLEKTLAALQSRGRVRPAVIEGDLETSRDAERIAKCGVPAVQINTQGGCHLDAAMIQTVLPDLPLKDINVLFIENVGNLVCPAEYDLGETHKVVALSVTEGDDKPSKYPVIFQRAQAAVVTKIDLLGHTDFSVDNAVRDMRVVHPDLLTFLLSARTGEGMDAWTEWIEKQV